MGLHDRIAKQQNGTGDGMFVAELPLSRAPSTTAPRSRPRSRSTTPTPSSRPAFTTR